MLLLAASYGVTVYADLDDGVRAPLAAVVAAAAVIAANERSEHSKVTELGLHRLHRLHPLAQGGSGYAMRPVEIRTDWASQLPLQLPWS